MSKFDEKRLDAHISEQMEKHKVPGLSITFSGDGVFYEKAFGYQDGARQKPVNPDTVMGIASLSKSFTGVCCALLEQQGKLSFDDPVTRYFPNFKIPGTPKDSVLVRHLLTHTSGLPPLPTLLHSMITHTTRDEGEKFDPAPYGKLLKVDTAEDIIDYIREGEYCSLGQPGEYMSYSNDGYAILSSIIDKAAQKPMEEFIEQALFAPLQMTRSALGYHRLKDFDNLTQVFYKDEESGEVKASDNWSMSPPYRGCGWIISTSRDLHKYYKMLSQGGVLDGKRILPQGAADRILGGDFPTAKIAVYTYGLNKVICRDEVLFTHTGGLKGVSSAGAFFKDKGVAGALVTNLGGVDAMRILMGAFNLIQGFGPDDVSHNMKLSDSAPQEPWIFEGYYGGRESGLPIFANPYKVVRDGDKLTVTVPGEKEPRELHFCGGTLFLAAKPGENPLREGLTVRFYVRNDKAWGVSAGSRLLQRI